MEHETTSPKHADEIPSETPQEEFRTMKRVLVISPYARLSTETSSVMIHRNRTYAELLYSLCCLRLRNQPIMPHLEYMNLPAAYLNPDLFSLDENNKSCNYYPGKSSTWRDYSSWIEHAENIIVGIDFGISTGMHKLIAESKINTTIIFVTIRNLKEICAPGSAEQLFFDQFPPVPLEEGSKTLDLITMTII